MRSTKLTKLSAILLGASLTAGVLGIACACGEEPDPTPPPAADPVASFKYEEVTGGIAITAYTGDPMDELTIPEKYENKNVVAIGDGALSAENSVEGAKADSLKAVKTIKFEAKITEIGLDNFGGMTALTEVTLPDTVTAVGGGCFYECPALTKVVIPSGEIALSAGTFTDCGKLASITLPLDIGDASIASFKNLASAFSITYADSAQLFRAKTIKIADNFANATVIGFNGKTTEKEGGFEYLLSNDGAYYTFVGFTSDIDTTGTEIYLPATHKEKPVKAIGNAAINANGYTGDLKTWLEETVKIVDANSAFQAKDTNIVNIGDYNYVGLKKAERITLPVEVENETLTGCFNSFGCKTQFRIPKGVKVLKDSLNWQDDYYFYRVVNAAGFLDPVIVLPASFERFEGVCLDYNAETVAAPLLSRWFVDCQLEELEAKWAAIWTDSTGTSGTWAAVQPFFATFYAASIATCEGGLIANPDPAIFATWGVYPTYQAVVDAGY